MRIDPSQKEVKILKRLLQLRGKRVLEIGCGEGRMSFPLAPLASHYLAIDPDEGAISEARKRLTGELKDKLEFQVAFGDKTGLPKKSVDTVFMLLCFHEIALQKQAPTLKECWRVLKDGGQVLIADPVDPPGQVQSLYDLVYKKIVFLDHPTMVRHSKWTVGEFVKSGMFKLRKKTHYKVDWQFDDLKELIGFIASEFRERVNWTFGNKRVLENGARKIIGDLGGDKVVVYETMEVFDLSKEVGCARHH